MSFSLKRTIKFLVYAFLVAVGFVLTFFLGRQGDLHSISHGNVYAPVAYADAPVSDSGDGDGDGDGSDGDGSGGDGDCGGDDGDDGY